MLTMRGTPPAFQLLAKPTGPICNLDCEYCSFLSKEMLYPGDGFGWPTTCWRSTSGNSSNLTVRRK